MNKHWRYFNPGFYLSQASFWISYHLRVKNFRLDGNRRDKGGIGGCFACFARKTPPSLPPITGSPNEPTQFFNGRLLLSFVIMTLSVNE
jgi:hypothetical protein